MPERPLLKVCGALAAADLELLAAAGADLVGLWHGVPGGHADLDLASVRSLVASAPRPRPVLVTLSPDAAAVDREMVGAGLSAVQLHGYQSPGVVLALKRADPARMVIKVLHVRADTGHCPERPLFGAYRRAGVDLVLFDVTAADGRIGSTGRSADPAVLAALAAETGVPFLVAGGVRPGQAARFAEVRALPGFAGVDVDSGVRDGRGVFDAALVRAVRDEWLSAVAA
ncbi:phosphoribosylanthranilate isomerase [Actinosynnema sp. CS-041913]|uniref:phosphoribosylanthranilate isomerase n=1 Tax=Actinosynnema sp. CS-041913 TaxID=3239917 RepID=UPI003D8C6DBE